MKYHIIFPLLFLFSMLSAQEVKKLDDSYRIDCMHNNFMKAFVYRHLDNNKKDTVILPTGKYINYINGSIFQKFSINQKGELCDTLFFGDSLLNTGDPKDFNGYALFTDGFTDSIFYLSLNKKISIKYIYDRVKKEETHTYYYTSGQINSINIFAEGKKKSSISYYENGKVSETFFAENSQRIKYSKTGKIYYKSYENNNKTYREYYENGILKRKTSDNTENWHFEGEKLTYYTINDSEDSYSDYTFDGKLIKKYKKEYEGRVIIDNDEDGIDIDDDKCPDIKGDRNSPLGVGCPMPADTDGDGLYDMNDKCPDEKGTYKGIMTDGCPNTIIEATEQIAMFKGSWNTFLAENIQYPKEAIDKNITGKVVVKFVVSTNGTISDVSAISGPIELREAAENAFRLSSGQWIPAKKNGIYVKAYGTQAVTFSLDNKQDSPKQP